ncbi:hypothetical protein LCGC14_0698730 [marine sediment metagenome]|uniref:Uncharacterized protein n=1 Tax=marine sediment metagenome TaxID=412755 RepID=A0A0F9QN36_9ZZZZ
MLQAKIHQLFGRPTPPEDVTRTFVRYACRLCGASGVSQLYRLQLEPHQRIAIRTTKDWFDYSCYRNTLFHALWTLAQRGHPTGKAVARQHGLDPDELRRQFRGLPLEERLELREQPEPSSFSDIQVFQTVQNIERYSRYLVKRYLRYCYNNDGSIDREDFWSDLTCQGIKIIRNYEVRGLTVAQMTPLVARGVANHVKNLAIYHGKDQRNPLLRLEQRSETREAWYCNVSADQVEHVWVYTTPQHRKGDYYLAEFDSRSPAYIYCRRLFDTAEEADASLLQYQTGKGSGRTTVVDLSASRADDWQPVALSLDTPSKEDGVAIINFLPTTSEQPLDDSPLDDLVRCITDPRARMFFQAVQGELGPLFDTYCLDATGHSAAELSEATLTRTAQRYCRISTKELRAFAP